MLTHDSESTASEAALRRGISAARAGLRSVAATLFERAAESLPDDPNVWLWLAWTANSPDNSLRCLERVLELSPGHAVATAGIAWAGLLAHDAPIEPVAVPVAMNHPEANVAVEVETQTDSTNPESPVVAMERIDSTTDVDAGPDSLPDSIHEAVVEQPLDSPKSCSVSDSVDNLEPVVPAAVAELPREMPPVESPLRRWSDLVQRNSETQTDAGWTSHVPPPLPSVVPPPLPLPATAEQTVFGALTRSRFIEPSAATARENEPVSEASADVEALTRSFNPPAGVASADGRPLVMVVDDSPTVRKLVSLTLERRGYRVVSAFDGVAAIKELGACRPDLILLDINMPRLDGYRLCKLIKKHEATQTIPVVMLSGKDGMFDKLRGRLVGCSDYITKPFEADALTHKVAKYLTPASSSL